MKDDEAKRIRLSCVEIAKTVYTQPHMRLYEVEDLILDYAEELAFYVMSGRRMTPKTEPQENRFGVMKSAIDEAMRESSAS